MLTNHSIASPRPAVLNAAVLTSFADAIAEPGWKSLVQGILQVAGLLAEEYPQPAAATVQLSFPAEDGLLTVKQAASTLDVSRQTIHNWVRKGDLPAHKMGSRTYFKKVELLGALRQKTRPDGFRKNARRSFTPSGKEVRHV